MYKVHCLNNIAKVGTDRLGENFGLTEDINEAQAIMVRSASLHETEFSNNLLAIGRAGAGVNNIPLDRCAEKGIVVFNTPSTRTPTTPTWASPPRRPRRTLRAPSLPARTSA